MRIEESMRLFRILLPFLPLFKFIYFFVAYLKRPMFPFLSLSLFISHECGTCHCLMGIQLCQKQLFPKFTCRFLLLFLLVFHSFFHINGLLSHVFIHTRGKCNLNNNKVREICENKVEKYKVQSRRIHSNFGPFKLKSQRTRNKIPSHFGTDADSHKHTLTRDDDEVSWESPRRRPINFHSCFIFIFISSTLRVCWCVSFAPLNGDPWKGNNYYLYILSHVDSHQDLCLQFVDSLPMCVDSHIKQHKTFMIHGRIRSQYGLESGPVDAENSQECFLLVHFSLTLCK